MQNFQMRGWMAALRGSKHAGGGVGVGVGQRLGQNRLRFGQALAAAGTDPEFTGQTTYRTTPAAICGSADLSVRDGLAHAYDHVAIVNANANDCQYHYVTCDA